MTPLMDVFTLPQTVFFLYGSNSPHFPFQVASAKTGTVFLKCKPPLPMFDLNFHGTFLGTLKYKGSPRKKVFTVF